jgi:hypothetical protein
LGIKEKPSASGWFFYLGDSLILGSGIIIIGIVGSPASKVAAADLVTTAGFCTTKMV